METGKIDIVIPWVDNHDLKWRKKASEYLNNVDLDGERYRDFDTLRYSVRSVQKNMPWVNHIYIVTDDQRPKWFSESELVSIIDHKDIIPKEYLPTFNSVVITSYLFKIPNLSDKFIILNDDMFVINMTKSDDYFKNNLPNDYLIERPTYPMYDNNHFVFNSVYAINKYFNKRETILNNILSGKILNIKYGFINNFVSIFLLIFRPYLGFYSSHSLQPYLKKSFEDSWNLYNEELKTSSSHKFRNSTDITDWLIRYHQLLNNQFKPSNPRKHGYYELGRMNKKEIERSLLLNKEIDICINDTISDSQIYLSDILIETLEKKFKNPSDCEIVREV